MKTTKKQYGEIGTVSHATMRPEELIPAFLEVLNEFRLSRNERAEYHAIARRASASEDSDYWTSEESGYDLEWLFDTLNVCGTLLLLRRDGRGWV